EAPPRVEVPALFVDEDRPPLSLLAVALAAEDRSFRYVNFNGDRSHSRLPFRKRWRILAPSPITALRGLSIQREMEVRPLEGQIVPDIATSWKVSRDGKTVTFKLRRGLKFHTGRPLTSQAIKEVYDAIADPKSGSPLRSVWVPHVTQTLAPDPTTLVLKLAHP